MHGRFPKSTRQHPRAIFPAPSTRILWDVSLPGAKLLFYTLPEIDARQHPRAILPSDALSLGTKTLFTQVIDLQIDKTGFADALLRWHETHARDLPWRGETDPYRIWLSEIMLQQTRTETVKRYYAAFLREFPTVFALADAEPERVLKCWEGMGYYSRARNLHAAAKQVARERNGVFPKTAETLRALPGVGAYAAGAIASIAYGERTPALDGNQARVLARVFNVTAEIRTPQALYAQAMLLMPREQTGEYNQAMMGLGALVCTPSPDCDACPVRRFCDAYAFGDPRTLPVKPEKKARAIENRAIALVVHNGRVLVRRRPSRGLLAGLWEFPGFPDSRTPDDVRACLDELGISARFIKTLPRAVHVFSHLEWHMTGFLFEADAPTDGFVSAEALAALPLPTALATYRRETEALLREPPETQTTKP